jgi:hypothetical protein
MSPKTSTLIPDQQHGLDTQLGGTPRRDTPEATPGQVERLSLLEEFRQGKAREAKSKARESIAPEHAKDIAKIAEIAKAIDGVDEQIFLTVCALAEQREARQKLEGRLSDLLAECRTTANSLGLPAPEGPTLKGPFRTHVSFFGPGQLAEAFWGKIAARWPTVKDLKLSDLSVPVQDLKHRKQS